MAATKFFRHGLTPINTEKLNHKNKLQLLAATSVMTKSFRNRAEKTIR
jgi:hypothetical protein